MPRLAGFTPQPLSAANLEMLLKRRRAVIRRSLLRRRQYSNVHWSLAYCQLTPCRHMLIQEFVLEGAVFLGVTSDPPNGCCNPPPAPSMVLGRKITKFDAFFVKNVFFASWGDYCPTLATPAFADVFVGYDRRTKIVYVNQIKHKGTHKQINTADNQKLNWTRDVPKVLFRHILFQRDLELWPFDLQIWSTYLYPRMHQCYEFVANPSNTFQDIVMTCSRRTHGRTDGRTNERTGKKQCLRPYYYIGKGVKHEGVFATGLPIDVMFGSRGGFRLSLDFYHRGFHTRTAVARNPCVSWAFLLLLDPV